MENGDYSKTIAKEAILIQVKLDHVKVKYLLPLFESLFCIFYGVVSFG